MSWAFVLSEPPRAQPWSEWLPPVGPGVVGVWLAQEIPSGAWVVDPFVAAPEVTVEMVHAGYRVLAITGNPVLAFLLRAAAVPPAEEELQATLAALAATQKGTQRLEPYLRSLYVTPCPRCGSPAEERSVLWERKGKAERPLRKEGFCAHCGEPFSVDSREEDAQSLAHWLPRAEIHRARLAERVAPLGSPHRQAVERWLHVLPPRSLEALTALLGRRSHPDLVGREALLDALLLLAVTAAWPQDEKGSPWQHWTLPTRYRERNLWHALEAGLSLWAVPRPAVPLVSWPQPLPAPKGILLFRGRVRDAIEALRACTPRAVVAVVPPPQPAFWALSALTTAWLWGREAMGPLEAMLTRGETDWGWYTAALSAAWRPLAHALPANTPFFAWLPQATPELLTAVVVAAQHSGWAVEALAPQSHPPAVQLILRQAAPAPNHAAETLRQALQKRNAPTAYLTALAAALQGYRPTSDMKPEAAYAQARHDLNLLFAEGPARPVGEEAPQRTLWLAAQPSAPSPSPLDDRVEETLLQLLAERTLWPERDLLNALYARFPAELTPSGDVVRTILEHYARAGPQGWQLRPEEHPQNRSSDLAEIRSLLRTLGRRFGYTVRGDLPLVWEHEGKEVARFYPTYLARTAPLLQSHPPGEAYLLLPGSRSPLWLFKVHRDPRLQQALQGPWRVLKFRHLRRLAREAQTWEDWQRLSPLDPPEHQDAQLPLL